MTARTAPEETGSPPPPSQRTVVPRWVQMVLLPLALLALWAMARAAGGVLLLFVIAALIALLLNPFVTLLRRRGVPRGLAVVAVYLALITVLAGAGLLLADPIADQVSAFRANVPEYVAGADDALHDFQGWLDKRDIGIEISDPGRTALETLGARLTEGSGSLVEFTREALAVLVEASLAVILTIVLSIYMLLYGERIGAQVRSVTPRGDGTPDDDFPTRIQRAVLGYVRGQLLFSTIMGASAGLMLYVLGSAGIFEDGRDYAVFFGIFFGFAELIPYIGPAIGAAPPVLIALFGAEPLDAVWLIVAFTALQQVEGHIVAPNVFAQALRINPILVIFALLMGGQLYGFIGAFISLPIAAMLRETVVYFRRHLVLEPWPTVPAGASAGAVAAAGAGVADRGPPDRPSAGAAPRAEAPASRVTSDAPGGEAPASAVTGAAPRAEAPASAVTDEAPGGEAPASAVTGAEARAEAPASPPAGADPRPGAQVAPSATPTAGADEAPVAACTECGTAAPAGAAYCPACGSELADPGASAAAVSSAPG